MTEPKPEPPPGPGAIMTAAAAGALAKPPLNPELVGRLAKALVIANKKTGNLQAVRDWARVDSMELFQAACLWADEAPPANHLFPMSAAARANLEMLKGAVISREIPDSEVHYRYQTLRNVDEQTRVTRKGLTGFAALKGERPAFLFPAQT